MSDKQPETMITPEAVPIRITYADVGSRGLAVLLDYAIILVLFWIVASIVDDATTAGSSTPVFLVYAIVIAVFWGYFILFEAAGGRTPGKMACRLRVVTLDGRRIGMKESCIRNALLVVDFLPSLFLVGIISIMATKKNQRLGDLAAGTVVMSERKEAPPEPLHLPPPQPDLPRIDVSGLGEDAYGVIRAYLLRRSTLPTDARVTIAAEIRTAIAPRVPAAANWTFGADLLLEQIAREYQARSGPLPPPPPSWLPPAGRQDG